MSISATFSSSAVARAQDQPARHPRRAELRRGHAGRAARVRVGGVRRQRGDGRRGLHHAAVGARGRAGHRADAVREHARPRARRLLPHARAAEGARSASTSSRPRSRSAAEHEIEGVIDLVDMKRVHGRTPPSAAAASEIAIPEELAERAQRVPREADGRGQRGLRCADGALSGGRGDLPRGDRRRAQGGHQPRQDLPGRVRRAPRATSARRACSTRSSRTCPRRSSTARCRWARSSSSADPDGELYAYVFKTRADPFAGRINLLRVYQGTLRADSHVLNMRAHAKERIGQLIVFAGKETSTCRSSARATSARSPSSRRPARATGCVSATSRSRCRALKLPAPVMAFADGGRRPRATRRRCSPRCAACRRRTRRSTCTATRRPASRSSRASRRCTSR